MGKGYSRRRDPDFVYACTQPADSYFLTVSGKGPSAMSRGAGSHELSPGARELDSEAMEKVLGEAYVVNERCSKRVLLSVRAGVNISVVRTRCRQLFVVQSAVG